MTGSADARKDDVAKLEIGTTGAKVQVPMGLIDRFAPTRYAKSVITATMGHQISEKLCKGEPLTERELFFFVTFFEKEMKGYLRKQGTRDHMDRLALDEPHAFPPRSEEAHVLSPADDAFAERFWEDVERVTDENVRELYARVGLYEDRKPGSFSLSTLSVLRDLDRKTKTIFELLCRRFVLQRLYLIRHRPIQSIYLKAGLSWSSFLQLAEAGLILLHDDTYHSFPLSKEGVTDIDFGGFEIRLRSNECDDKNFVSVPIFPLSTAGEELARLILNRSICKEYVRAVSQFLQHPKPPKPRRTGLWSRDPRPVCELSVEWRLSDGGSDFQPVGDLEPEE